jgi:hypothetical protein
LKSNRLRRGVISPLLANLYLHHALDTWLQTNYPKVTFERYADDAVIHCESEEEAAISGAVGGPACAGYDFRFTTNLKSKNRVLVSNFVAVRIILLDSVKY